MHCFMCCHTIQQIFIHNLQHKDHLLLLCYITKNRKKYDTRFFIFKCSLILLNLFAFIRKTTDIDEIKWGIFFCFIFCNTMQQLFVYNQQHMNHLFFYITRNSKSYKDCKRRFSQLKCHRLIDFHLLIWITNKTN